MSSLVDRSGGENACWLWMRGLDKDGYGKFAVTNYGRKPGEPKQRHIRAHRYAFEITHGTPPKLLIAHACDNPRCCNPAHLEDASQKKNREDCAQRGRTAKGDRHGSHTHPEKWARKTKE